MSNDNKLTLGIPKERINQYLLFFSGLIFGMTFTFYSMNTSLIKVRNAAKALARTNYLLGCQHGAVGIQDCVKNANVNYNDTEDIVEKIVPTRVIASEEK